MIYLVGLSVAFFLFVLILFKRNKKQPDYILLTWIAVIALHISLFIIHYKGIVYRYPHLLGIGLALPVLHGMFLYLYTIALIRENHISHRSVLLHLVPFFILVLLAFPFYVLSAEEKIEVFENQGRGFEWYSQLQSIVFTVAGLSYSIASIWQIRRHRKLALNSFSNMDKKMLRWLEFLAVGLVIIWLISAFPGEEITFAAVVLFVLFMGFFGINQYPVFYSIPGSSTKSEIPPSSEAPAQLPDDTGKYAKSRLNEDEAASVMTLLETVVNAQKPFKKPDLTLNELADYINVSPNHLSQVINTVAGKTFYHYINTYRIEEFLKLAALPESRRFTYLGLAFQCGFTSKTTFNKYFKLQTGKTPSEYFGITSEKAEVDTFAQK
jgi:AraC-like DNA-binding protein